MTLRTTLLILGVASAAPVLAQTKPTTREALERFQRAVALEEQRGDAKAALAIYEALADAEATPHGLRARARYRSAVCLETLGRTAKARAAYQEVIRRYATLAKLVEKARAGVKRLAPRPKPAVVIQETVSVTAAGEGKVALEAKNADIREVIASLADFGKLDYAIAPSIHGQVTTKLSKISPLAALRLIVHTAGDFVVLSEPGRRYVRVTTRSALESERVTRVYPLRKVPATPKGEASRRGVLETVRELIRSHGIAGAAAVYDRPGASLVVTHTLPGQAAVRKVLRKQLRAATKTAATKSATKPAGPRVSVRFTDANVRVVLRLIGAQAKRPVLISGLVAGPVSLSLRDVPVGFALRETARAVGDYEVVETPAATLILSRSQVETTLTTERWPLLPKPRAFWTVDQALPAASGGLPAHPLERWLHKLVHADGVAGVAVGLDRGGHALVVSLTPTQRTALRRVLAQLGYVAPEPESKKPAKLVKLEDVDIRAVLGGIASAAGVNLVIAPQVRGRLTGSYDAGADPEQVMRIALRVVGDYELVRAGPKLYRATTRSALEQTVRTERVTLKRRSGASAKSLYRVLQDQVKASGIAGALAVLDPANRAFVLSLPLGLMETVQALIAAADRPGIEPQLEGLVLPVYRPHGTRPVVEPRWVVGGRALDAEVTKVELESGVDVYVRGEQRIRVTHTGSGPVRSATLSDGATLRRTVTFPPAAFVSKSPAKRRPRRVR